MITGRVPSEVCDLRLVRCSVPEARQAAFLTQTVTLEDQTTVKFEIWWVHLLWSFLPCPFIAIQGYGRTGTLQGMSPASLYRRRRANPA